MFTDNILPMFTVNYITFNHVSVTTCTRFAQSHYWIIIAVNNKSICPIYLFYSRQTDDSLPTGDWNTRGCSPLINGDTVSCSCNHLTHFAILLSPGVQVENDYQLCIMAWYVMVNYMHNNSIIRIQEPIMLHVVTSCYYQFCKITS